MRIEKIKVYKFNELNEKSQNQVLIDFIQFLSEISNNFFTETGKVKKDYKDYFVVKAIQECEKTQTPWFFGETLFHDYKKELINEIEINEYEFLSDGKVFVKS